MTSRNADRGLFYGRRSTDKQEHSLDTQVDWAVKAARDHGIRLNADSEFLKEARQKGISNVGDLYIDDAVSGSNADRPGLIAFYEKALRNPSVSHVFIHKRDRFARPDNPADAAGKEYALIQAGITVVFSDGVAKPTEDGKVDIAHLITATIEYHRSGAFLQDLSSRVLETQRALAMKGFSTGGRAPYGFGRFLMSPTGEVVEELTDGKRVRQEGFHVIHLPNDDNKIGVWISMLQMRERGMGYKAIANKLNDMGIPSPNAGRIRTDGGAQHKVSGKWNHNTVKELCNNPIIIGQLQYGTRSEGKHRRFTKEGSRPVAPSEKADSESVKTVINPESERIVTKASFDPQFCAERYAAIQAKSEARSSTQRGIPKMRDQSKYPLSTRVVDLADGCGSLMYGVPQTNQKMSLVYKCGRYVKTQECNHNKVDAEKLLELVLRSLKHMIRRTGSQSKLVQKLIELAGSGSDSAADLAASESKMLTDRIEQLNRERTEIAQKLAVEEDTFLQTVFRSEIDKKGAQAVRLRAELDQMRPEVKQGTDTPQEQVDKALKLLDKLEEVINVPESRPRINEMLRKLGVWIGIDFHGVKWGKREVRRVRAGIMNIGGYQLPVPLHGRDNCDPHNSGADCGCSTDPDTATEVSVETPGGGDAESSEKTAKDDEKGDSFTKVNRGDTI